MFRQLLRKLCLEELHCQVVGEAASVEEGKRVLQETRPDIAILDLRLPGGDGFELIQFVHDTIAGVAVLVVSAHADAATIARLKTLNIAGFVEKTNESLVTLTLAVNAIMHGQRFFCDAYHRPLRQAEPPSRSRAVAVLSARERQVLGLIGEAMSDVEIAQALGLTRTTAQTYRSQIMRKVGIKSTPKLMRFALVSGLSNLRDEQDDF